MAVQNPFWGREALGAQRGGLLEGAWLETDSLFLFGSPPPCFFSFSVNGGKHIDKILKIDKGEVSVWVSIS